jgi:hypothetical protein
VVVGVALGKLANLLDGDTVCVASWSPYFTETRSALGKLGKLVQALDGDTVCVAVGAALGKLVDVLDGDTVCLHHDK